MLATPVPTPISNFATQYLGTIRNGIFTSIDSPAYGTLFLLLTLISLYLSSFQKLDQYYGITFNLLLTHQLLAHFTTPVLAPSALPPLIITTLLNLIILIVFPPCTNPSLSLNLFITFLPVLPNNYSGFYLSLASTFIVDRTISTTNQSFLLFIALCIIYIYISMCTVKPLIIIIIIIIIIVHIIN